MTGCLGMYRSDKKTNRGIWQHFTKILGPMEFPKRHPSSYSEGPNIVGGTGLPVRNLLQTNLETGKQAEAPLPP